MMNHIKNFLLGLIPLGIILLIVVGSYLLVNNYGEYLKYLILLPPLSLMVALSMFLGSIVREVFFPEPIETRAPPVVWDYEAGLRYASEDTLSPEEREAFGTDEETT